MATYTDILANLKTALNTLATNGGVEEVEHADGTRVRYTRVSDITRSIQIYENLAANEAAEGTKKPARTYGGFARRPS